MNVTATRTLRGRSLLAVALIVSALCEWEHPTAALAQENPALADSIERVGAQSLFRSRPLQLSVTQQGNTVVVRDLPKPYLHTVAARPVSGAFLVMWSDRPTATGATATDESVHLADDQGHVIESWEMPEGVVSIVAPGRRAYVLTGGSAPSVFRLDPQGKRTVITQGIGDDQQVLGGPQGKVVLCRQTNTNKDPHPTDPMAANCRSQLGWSFEGTWFHVDPITCGEWLIEPVQDARKDPREGFNNAKARKTIALQVRSLADGSVRTRAPFAASRLRCLDGKWLFDLGSQTRFSLPELGEATAMRCGKQRASSVAQRGTPTACLDERGKVGVLEDAPIGAAKTASTPSVCIPDGFHSIRNCSAL
jgi:hypothetical protein